MSTEARMYDVIYRVGEWECPPLWRPFAFRRWQQRARAELHRLFELRCEEEREAATSPRLTIANLDAKFAALAAELRKGAM